MSGRRKGVVREPVGQGSGAGQWTYLESSALIAGLIEHDLDVLASVDPARTLLSALTIAESRRAIIRAMHARRLAQRQAAELLTFIDALARRCRVVAVTDEILARAGRTFPVEPIRTLDAIHLATAELLDSPGAPVSVLTRDDRIRTNAVQMGLRIT